MNFDLTPEQLMWRDSCAEFARGLRVDGKVISDGDAWQRLSALGALELAESGAEYLTELALLFEEIGRVAAPVALLEPLCGAVVAGKLGLDDVQLLSSGHVWPGAERVTGDWAPVEARSSTTAFVALVDASAVVLAPGAAGLRFVSRKAMDGQPTMRVVADAVEPMAVVPAEVVTPAFDLLAVGRAAELLGGAGEVLRRTVDYARERVVFGRPIGRFQAVQHALADVEISRWAAYLAVYEAAARGALAEHDHVGAQQARALSLAARAYLSATTTASHVIAGIGHIDDHWLPAHYMRAKELDLRTGGESARALECLLQFRTVDG